MHLPAAGRRAGPPGPRVADGPPPPGEAGPGKVVTVVANLDPAGNDLPALAVQLKTKCGTGGTVKDGLIELQGDHIAAAEGLLVALGYKTRRG
jgi:translation initiation factor 1